MQPALDRFSVPVSWERNTVPMTDELYPETCDICGDVAHYRIRGLKDVYCRPCAREVAVDLNLDPNEEVELIT